MLNPSRFRILAIGKVRKEWVRAGLTLYMKRLPGLTITELRDSTPIHEEEAIRASLKRNEKLVALTEEGESFSSCGFAGHLQKFESQKIAFAIGGADGLSVNLKASAHWQLSLSPMTFPHEVARLLLVEQIYRAQSILQRGPYHRSQ